MKNLLFVIVAFVFLAACKTNSTVDPTGNIKLFGKIDTAKGGQIYLLREGLNEYKIDTIKINVAGEYNFEFEATGSDFYTLAYNENYMQLYLSPGDDFSYSLIGNKISVSGKAATRAKFIKSVSEIKQKLGLRGYSTYSMEENEFVAHYDSIFNYLESEIIKRKDSVDTELYDIVFSNAKFAKAQFLMNYPGYHAYFAKLDSFDVSENYYDFIKTLDLNNPKLLISKDFKDFINAYLEYNISKILEADTTLEKTHAMYIDEAKKVSTNKEIQASIMFNYLYSTLKYEGIKDIESSIKTFKEFCQNETFNQKLDELYNKWNKIAKGQPATNFSYPDTAGTMISLSDFKGKYVYIDVWATWCRPCLGEIPSMKSVIEQFDGKNIVFMGVSVDELDAKDKWKNMVAEKELKGYQIYAGGWKSTIATEYNINSIPRFILIDREGNIIDANATRPSEEALINQLNELEGI